VELFTERLLLKDILPERAKDIAKKYHLKENDIEFIRKKNPLSAEDLTIEDGERAAIRYVNTADVDRDNEIVLPSGGQVNDFKKSPTVLYAHNYQGLPIGKDIWIKLIQGKGWLAKTVYAKHQLADDVYNLVKEKFLNTSSIGFIPLESVKPEDKDWGKIGEIVKSEYGINEKVFDKAKRIYTKWILLEHSDVPIPSNISALNIAVGKGLEIKSKELIDDLEIEIVDDEAEPEDKSVDEIIDEIDKETEAEEEKQKEIEEIFSDEAEPKPEEKEVAKPIENDGIKKPEAKEKPSKGFSLDEIYEIVKENRELVATLEDLTAELKSGAVLNRKNKQNLKDAQNLIQTVLDSAEPAEAVEEEAKDEGIEIEDDGLEIEEKEAEEEPEEPENENKGIDIDEKEIIEIIHSALKENIGKSVENVSKSIKQDIDDNFKRLTGKVM